MPKRGSRIIKHDDHAEIVIRGARVLVDLDCVPMIEGRRVWRLRGTVCTYANGRTMRLIDWLDLPKYHADGNKLDCRRANMLHDKPKKFSRVRTAITVDGDYATWETKVGTVTIPAEYVAQCECVVWYVADQTAKGYGKHIQGVIEGRQYNLARYIHTLAHGPVPDGHAVRCLNGDRLDCRLDNLELFVPRMGRKQKENAS
jgi:hypothetical protein